MTADVSSPGVIARDASQFRFAGRQPNSAMPTDSPQKLWDTAIPQAQKRIDDPIVWLAMQSARALALEKDLLVLAVPAEVEYLAACLTDDKNQPIFVDILTSVVQRPMQMRVILGESVEDWQKIRQHEGLPDLPSDNVPPPVVHEPGFQPGSRDTAVPPGVIGARETTIPPVPTTPREVSLPPVDEHATRRMSREQIAAVDEKTEERRSTPWDSTLERISRGLASTPMRQFPQGRAHYFLNCIRIISEKMDQMIEEAGGVRSELFERGVSRAIDRLAQAVEFDPLLVALELERYREGHRKGIGDYSEAIKSTTLE